MTGMPRLLPVAGRGDGASLPARPVTTSSLSQDPAEVTSMTQPRLRASQPGGRAARRYVESLDRTPIQLSSPAICEGGLRSWQTPNTVRVVHTSRLGAEDGEVKGA